MWEILIVMGNIFREESLKKKSKEELIATIFELESDLREAQDEKVSNWETLTALEERVEELEENETRGIKIETVEDELKAEELKELSKLKLSTLQHINEIYNNK